jgi:hypothetical protein
MTYELSTEEKVSIVNQHLRNISFKKYNLDLSLAEEQALSTPSQERINEINSDIAEVAAQTAVLLLELESLA